MYSLSYCYSFWITVKEINLVIDFIKLAGTNKYHLESILIIFFECIILWNWIKDLKLFFKVHQVVFKKSNKTIK